MTQFAKDISLDYKIAPKTKNFDRGLSLERDPTFAEKSNRKIRQTHTHTCTHFEVVDSTEVENIYINKNRYFDQ